MDERERDKWGYPTGHLKKHVLKGEAAASVNLDGQTQDEGEKPSPYIKIKETECFPASARVKGKPATSCKIEGCLRAYHGKGYCKHHYNAQYELSKEQKQKKYAHMKEYREECEQHPEIKLERERTRKWEMEHQEEVSNTRAEKKGRYNQNYCKEYRKIPEIRKADSERQNTGRGRIRSITRSKIPLIGKQCERCGASNNLHRHHLDYSEPLKVLILCKQCHGLIHGKRW